MLNFKVLFAVSFIFAVANAMPGTLSAAKELEGNDLKEAENVLQNSLTKLAAEDGPFYTISKVHSATLQFDAGDIYKYKVDLEDQDKNMKDCDVSIYSHPWLHNGQLLNVFSEVTFECEDEPKIVKNHGA